MIELLLQAERLLSVGLLDKAEQLYRQVAKADPKNSIAVVGLARVTLDRGDDEGALELARKGLAIDPENAAAQRMVARLEEVLEYRESAESLLFDRTEAVSALQAEVAADVAAEVGSVPSGAAAAEQDGAAAESDAAEPVDAIEADRGPVADEAEPPEVAEPDAAAPVEAIEPDDVEPELIAEPEETAEADAAPAPTSETPASEPAEAAPEPDVAPDAIEPAGEPEAVPTASDPEPEVLANPESPDVSAVPEPPAPPWAAERVTVPGSYLEPGTAREPVAPDVPTEPQAAGAPDGASETSPIAGVWTYLERLFRRR